MAETNGVADWGDENNVELPSRLYCAWAYAATGDSDRAKDSYAAVLKQMRTALVLLADDANLHVALGFAAAGLGLIDEAVREGCKATGLMPISRDALSGTRHLGWLAERYVRVGDTDHALDLLQQQLAIPAGNLISPTLLNPNPFGDRLRKIPRIQKFVAAFDDAAKGQL